MSLSTLTTLCPTVKATMELVVTNDYCHLEVVSDPIERNGFCFHAVYNTAHIKCVGLG